MKRDKHVTRHEKIKTRYKTWKEKNTLQDMKRDKHVTRHEMCEEGENHR